MSILLLHWQVFVSTVTTLASVCLYCYHTGKYMSVLLPHWQVSVYTVTTLASICRQCYHIDKYISVVLSHKTSICQYCYHISFRKCMSLLLPHWQVFVSTVTTLASACLYFYHTGKYMTGLLPYWRVSV